MSNNASDTIFDTWELYRKIVYSNNMFHQEIYADVASVLQNAESDFSLLDLGCGDAAMLAPVLTALPIAAYHGVDLSGTALALAEQNLQSLGCPRQLQLGDMLQCLTESAAQFDVIFSSFALHHLTYGQKAAFFKAACAQLKPNGFLLLIDTLRAEQEDLPTYLAAYCAWLRDDWQGIDDDEKQIACEHIISNDFPETLSTFALFSEQAGFSAFNVINQYRWHHVLCCQR